MRGRWDIDERGHGITDARWLAPDAEALLAAITAPDWIAEDPDAHLLPHLERAVAEPTSPWQLARWRDEAGVLVLELRWQGDTARGLRADAFALLGEIAEAATLVRERPTMDGMTTFDLVTGMLDGDGAFATHGHTVRLIVRR
jgi:hypothetical protein